jgi:hypothetical protein
LVLWKNQRKKSTPHGKSKARDLVFVMGKKQIHATILKMQKKVVKDIDPNLLLEIHMNSIGG